MVIVNLYAEGGVHPNDKVAVSTIDNSNFLRESFSQLINSGVNTEGVKVELFLSGATSSAIKGFKNDEKALALIDLDAPETERSIRLQQLHVSDRAHQVFFMIQAMEAWILSQPDRIEACFAGMKRTETTIVDDESIKNVHTKDIPKPDAVLNRLLFQNFAYSIGDTLKPLKYGKLKNAHLLLEKLDINRLKNDFTDVENLLKTLNSA